MTRRRLQVMMILALAAAAGVWIFHRWRREASALSAVVRADAFRVYEGLPHPLFEQELLKSERRSKKTVELEGFPFYAPPLAPDDAVVESLRRRISGLRLRDRPMGLKKCGGFHPDSALEWDVGADQYLLLLCLRCSEAKLYGPGFEVYRDLDATDAAAFSELLAACRRRPPDARRRTEPPAPSP